MGKLKNLKPRLASMRSRLARDGSGTRDQYDRWRDENQSWRALYKTARWQKLRWQVLVRDAFTCQMPGHDSEKQRIEQPYRQARQFID
jgi:5-methylcytosine-specific restriction protein A